MAIGCPHDDFWKLLVKSIGCPGLADDARYLTTADRIARHADVEGLVSGWTGTRTKAEISAVLGGKIPFGPVLRIDEILADPHARARQMLAEVELPSTEPDQRLTLAGTAVKMTGTPGGVRHRAPLTGEHTAKILAEFGYGEADIAALEAKGAVVRR